MYPEYPADGNVEEVKAWVGDDADRAREALEHEARRGSRTRSTLVTHLNDLLDALEGEPVDGEGEGEGGEPAPSQQAGQPGVPFAVDQPSAAAVPPQPVNALGAPLAAPFDDYDGDVVQVRANANVLGLTPGEEAGVPVAHPELQACIAQGFVTVLDESYLDDGSEPRVDAPE